MTRLGLALDAKAETFMGLSGLGDLVLTATEDLVDVSAISGRVNELRRDSE
jgi:hypothetical protein